MKAKKINEDLNSPVAVLDTLSTVRLAAILQKGHSSLHSPAVEWKLEKTDAETAKLFSQLTKQPS